MGSADEVLELFLSSEVPYAEARELWLQAAKALAKMPADIDASRRDRIFDRLVDEAPQLVYRLSSEVPEVHRAALLETLGRCRDPEARLLVAAGPKAFIAAAALLRVLEKSTNCPGVVANLAKGGEDRVKGVLSACVDVVTGGYPARTSIPFAGMFGAVMIFGTPAQAKAILANDPPAHAVGWLGATAKKMPKDRAALVRARIEGVADADDPDDDAPRYVKLHGPTARPTKKVISTTTTTKSSASGAALLSAVYAAPEDDAPRAVYADWLLESGDPFGEFIQLQLARATGKKGTASKEKLLLDAAKGKFWPEHPTTIGGVISPSWDWTERGFPSVFQGELSKKARAKLRGNPGWSTIRTLWCDYRHPDSLVDLDLPAAMSVRALRTVGLESLVAIAPLGLPVETMDLDLTELPPKTLVTSFPRLSRLDVLCVRASVPDTVERLGAIGLTRSLSVLGIGRADDAMIPLALDTFAGLEVKELSLGTHYRLVRVIRGPKAPALEISAESSALDGFLDELASLPPKRVSEVHVILAAGGFYTKKTRPIAEKRAKEVLKRFASGKVSSPTK